MARFLYRVYPSNRRIKIWKYKIIRETKTKYYVGAFVPGDGYIKKGRKGDFTSLKDAEEMLQKVLADKIDKLTDQLLAAKTASDAYVDGIDGREILVDKCLSGCGLMGDPWWGTNDSLI